LRLQKALIGALVLLFCARSVDIGRIYNHTFDEPTQIASGLELWQYGTFLLHADVPPLAKLLMTAPAYIAGVRLEAQPARGDLSAGNQLLYGSGRYWFVLRSARGVNTAIGALLVVALAWFCWTTFGAWAAVAAAAVAASSPGLVSAASTANSDILGVLTVLATFCSLGWLLKEGGLWRVVAFALMVGASLATKLSSVPFLVFGLPVIAVFTLGRGVLEPFRRRLVFLRRHGAVLAIGALTVPVAIWATYGFSMASPVGTQEAAVYADLLRPRAPRLAQFVTTLPEQRWPLGGFVRGVGVGYEIARRGHPAYLMGEWALHGWPYYFLVTLLLKVPLGTLVAVLLALVVAWRDRASARGRVVLLMFCLCAAILASVARAGVNAGHRHVVSVEALFALIIAGGLSLAISERTRWRWLTVSGLTGSLVVGAVASVRAHPDALGYTNTLAGADPDWWFIDSNLDWGQDLERLRLELSAQRASGPIHLAYFGTADPARHGINFQPLKPAEHVRGWIAISANSLRGLAGAGIGLLPSDADRNGYRWLLDYRPVARIGTSIRLYHLDGPTAGLENGVGNRLLDARDEPLERVELLNSPAAFPAHPLALLWMGPQVLDGVPQGARIPRRHEKAVRAILEDISLSIDAAADDCFSHRHCLSHHGHAVVGICRQQRDHDEARAGIQGAQLLIPLGTHRDVSRNGPRVPEVRHPLVGLADIDLDRNVARHVQVAEGGDQRGIIAHLASHGTNHVSRRVHGPPKLLVYQPSQLDDPRGGYAQLLDCKVALDGRPDDDAMNVRMHEAEERRFLGRGHPGEQPHMRRLRPGYLQESGQGNAERLSPRDDRVVLTSPIERFDRLRDACRQTSVEVSSNASQLRNASLVQHVRVELPLVERDTRALVRGFTPFEFRHGRPRVPPICQRQCFHA
jgi:hypothetical protein